MRRVGRPFFALRHLSAVLFVSFAFISFITNIAQASVLTVAERTTLFEEEMGANRHYFTREMIGIAYGGETEALLYWDDKPTSTMEDEALGLFMLLLGPDSIPVTDAIPIKQKKAQEQKPASTVLWDGEAFLVLYLANQQVYMKRISTTGEVLSDTTTDVFITYSDCIDASVDGSKIRLLASDTISGIVMYAEVKRSGEKILGPIRTTASGEIRKAVLQPQGIAILSCRSWQTQKGAFLELFDFTGNATREPIALESGVASFSGDMHWNGKSFVITSSIRKQNKISMKLSVYDQTGKSLIVPKPLGEDSLETPQLVWGGGCYLLFSNKMASGHSVRLIDTLGNPLSEPIPLEEGLPYYRTLLGILAGDTFAAYGLEGDPRYAAIAHLKITWDTLAPTFTPTPTPPADAPTPTPNLPADAQELNLKVYAETKVLFVHVQGSRLWLDTGTTLPSEKVKNATVEVNGQEWKPVWTKTLTDAYAINPPLPRSDGYYYRSADSKFGSFVPLIQEPKASNQYEAVLYVDSMITNQYGTHHEIKLIWSKTPLRPVVPLPEKNYLLWRGLITMPYFGPVQMKIQGRKIELFTTSMQKVFPLDTVFSEPLPPKPIAIQAKILQGGLLCYTTQQPQADNQYTARINLEAPSGGHTMGAEVTLLITWTDGAVVGPTPTPLPTWNSAAPTPTPIADVAKVLWVLNPDLFTVSATEPAWYSDFLTYFEDLGAQNEFLLAGSKPIASDLLQGCAAVVFGSIFNRDPLNAEEQGAVLDYVRGGGSILVLGSTSHPYIPNEAVRFASSVTQPFGVEFSGAVSGTHRDFRRYLLLSGIRKIVAFNGGSVLKVSPPAQAIAFADTGDPVLAVAEAGYGRVIAYSSANSFYNNGVLPNEGIRFPDNNEFAGNLAAWMLHQEETHITPLPPEPTPTPTSPLSGQDTEAKALLDRMLQANRPWLDPCAIKATYRRVSSTGNEGPIVEVDEGGASKTRVGAWFYTPLHALYHSGLTYQVKMIGETIVGSEPAIAVDVTLSEEALQYLIGKESSITERYFRIGIEPEKKLPLFISSSKNPIRSDQTAYIHAWTFDPEFFEVDGGYAPTAVLFEDDFYSYTNYYFQVYEGVWILEFCEYWSTEDNPWTFGAQLLEYTELIDLQIEQIYTPVGNWMTY